MRTKKAFSTCFVVLATVLALAATGADSVASASDGSAGDDVWRQIAERAIQIPVLRPAYVPAVLVESAELGHVATDNFLVTYRSGARSLTVVAGSFNLPEGGRTEEIDFRGTKAELIRYPARDGVQESVLTWWEAGGPYQLGRPPHQRTGITPYAVGVRGLPVDELLKIANSLSSISHGQRPSALPRAGNSRYPAATAASAGVLFAFAGALLRRRSRRARGELPYRG